MVKGKISLLIICLFFSSFLYSIAYSKASYNTQRIDKYLICDSEIFSITNILPKEQEDFSLSEGSAINLYSLYLLKFDPYTSNTPKVFYIHNSSLIHYVITQRLLL